MIDETFFILIDGEYRYKGYSMADLKEILAKLMALNGVII